jgi:queuine tRNA-ribosyltransferase
VEYQEDLGDDVMMVLDECPPHDGTREQVEAATDRTHRWAERCLGARRGVGPSLFGIVQGGAYPDLRRRSAESLVSLGFPGYAIGGLSLGESKKTMLDMIEATTSFLPEEKPRYLMGVGSPEDIVEGVARGIDIFDCALPTRVASNGALFTSSGRKNVRNAVYRLVNGPVDPDCACYCCRTFSAAYLHHLFNARELLAYHLASVHNLTFMARLLGQIRGAIVAGSFSSFRRSFLDGYRTTDESVRIGQKEKWLQKQRSDSR